MNCVYFNRKSHNFTINFQNNKDPFIIDHNDCQDRNLRFLHQLDCRTNLIIYAFMSYSFFYHIILCLKYYINFDIFFYLYNFNILMYSYRILIIFFIS